MKSEDFVSGMHCKLPVIKEKSHSNYFYVYTEDGDEYGVPKLKFQRDAKIPDEIDVYVKMVKDGYYDLGQDLSKIIPEFYSEGEEYFFKIKSKKAGKEDVYNVEDEHGLYFTLNKAPKGLHRGRTIKCKVLKINKVCVILKYAGILSQQMKLRFLNPREWMEWVGYDRRLGKVLLNFIKQEPDFSDAEKLLESNDPAWIFTFLSLFSQNAAKYLISAKDCVALDETTNRTAVIPGSINHKLTRRRINRVLRVMGLAQDICMLIIQKSDYLRECDPEQRSELQRRLSSHVELFKQLGRAACLITENNDEEFIAGIFEDLKKAGFLYHPSKQFRIMMTILRLRPELINSRMTELFDALHSWPQNNWEEEPFRSALVDQLEIYIKENCDSLNSIPANEGPSDNQLNRVIRAIAIQSLLARQRDHIDLARNKTMFYRFLSNFRTHDVDDLLYKAVGAILGNDYAHDFSWDDTSRFQMLQEKASRMVGTDTFASLPPKVLATDSMSIELRPKEIVVRDRYASDDDSVLPNGIFDWMSPKILLRDRVKTPNAAKKNDLRSYGEMWSDIENALFASSEVEISQTGVQELKKRTPDDGEEVEIMIVDCIVDSSRNSRHQLMFKCVIVSDTFEGEGWLVACKEDFVPWLDERDLPMNYDGNIDIFKNQEGTPLLFPAKVKNSGSTIYFTMKKEIERHLVDITEFNEESHSTIRDIDVENNRYICLSDRGYSLLVPIDDSNRGYERGAHVTVRYIGRHDDKKHNSLLFMDGAISEYISDPGVNFTKTEPLKNLMQSIGHPYEDYDEESEEVTEVFEAQEIMSREEMHEIILMLQRKAYAEKEYIQAFNYLGLGAVLARAVEDTILYDEMKLHQKLLEQLQYYARNRKVNHEELSKYEEKVKGHAILQKLFTKLDIVASISRPEYNNKLWELTTEDDETESLLASLVLSLNLLPEDEKFEKSRKEIDVQIAKILNVNSNETKLKYYGEEDLHQEFKSSLVFTNKKQDHMAARPEAQKREIREIICGFLNSQGGTLYIGVNDSGYEAGLEEDKRYFRSRGQKGTLDGIRIDLENDLRRHLPGYAVDQVSVSVDTESVKGVLKVEVNAVERPVALGDTYFVRNSSSTIPKLGEDLKDYLEMRSENYRNFIERRRQAQLEIERKHLEEERLRAREEIRIKNEAEAEALRQMSAKQRTPEKNEISETSEASDVSVITEAVMYDGVTTGHHRRNILHDYEPGFVHPALYMHFNSDHTYYVTAEDQYNESDAEKRMVLAVSEEEMQQFLVVGFADGTVVKTPMAELVGVDPDKRQDFYDESEVRFINIAPEDKCLLTFLKNETNGLVYARIDHVEDLYLSHNLKNGGKTLIDQDVTILRQDVITEEKANFIFPKISDLSRRNLGSQLKFSNLKESIEDRVAHYQNQIAASND